MGKVGKWQHIEKWFAEHRLAGKVGWVVLGVVLGFPCGVLLVYFTPRIEWHGKALVPPTATPTATATPAPTFTPDWELRQGVSDFVREFWRAEWQAFKSGDLDGLKDYFCTRRGFEAPWSEVLEPFSQYKEDGSKRVTEGLCPFTLDDVRFPDETPSGEPEGVQVMTEERWAKGPCPTDGSSGLEQYQRRVVIERSDSGWCIGDSSMEVLEPQ